HAEPRARAGDAQIAGDREFESCAERVAVDARDHRNRQPAQAIARAVHEGDEITRAVAIKRGHLRNARAADEGLLTGSAHNERAQILAFAEPLDGIDKGAHQRAIENVEFGAMIDRETTDYAL